jgi:hypothetical protein
VLSTVTSLKEDIESQQKSLEQVLTNEFKNQLALTTKQLQQAAVDAIGSDLGEPAKKELAAKLSEGFGLIADKFNRAFEQAADDISSRVTSDLERTMEKTLNQISSEVEKEIVEIRIISGDLHLLCHLPENPAGN